MVRNTFATEDSSSERVNLSILNQKSECSYGYFKVQIVPNSFNGIERPNSCSDCSASNQKPQVHCLRFLNFGKSCTTLEPISKLPSNGKCCQIIQKFLCEMKKAADTPTTFFVVRAATVGLLLRKPELWGFVNELGDPLELGLGTDHTSIEGLAKFGCRNGHEALDFLAELFQKPDGINLPGLTPDDLSFDVAHLIHVAGRFDERKGLLPELPVSLLEFRDSALELGHLPQYGIQRHTSALFCQLRHDSPLLLSGRLFNMDYGRRMTISRTAGSVA